VYVRVSFVMFMYYLIPPHISLARKIVVCVCMCVYEWVCGYNKVDCFEPEGTYTPHELYSCVFTH